MTSDPLQSPLQVDISSEGRAHLVRLSGSASIEESEELRITLNQLVSDSAPNLVLDLSGLTYITSVGIGALVAAHHRTKKLSGRIVMVNPSPAIQRLLTLIHIDRLIDVFPTTDAALAALQPHT
ncbi:MAG: STAS domain-containing protein [Phycisphaerales bacterium]|nr:STAS domain-containing protein [Phycisphaerales bacterium]